jgi:hypothetical protein
MKKLMSSVEYVEMEPGWIERGFKSADEDIKKWPQWMKREAGLLDEEDDKRRTRRARSRHN